LQKNAIFTFPPYTPDMFDESCSGEPIAQVAER